MQTAEDVHREVALRLTGYLTWIKESGGWYEFESELQPWSAMRIPYVCQRGFVFDVGPMRVRDAAGIRLTPTTRSICAWYTRCVQHSRDRRDRFMKCYCYPVYRADLLALHRLGGIAAIGTQSTVVHARTPASPRARSRYVDRPTYRAHYRDEISNEWRARVHKIVEGLDFENRCQSLPLHDLQ